MGGSKAELAPNANNSPGSASSALNALTSAQRSPAVQDLLNKYSSGQMSLSDALGEANKISQSTSSQGLGNINYGGALQNSISQSPIAAEKYATEQVQGNPLTSGLFGKGGIQDQAQGNYGTNTSNLASDRNALMGRDQSYGLTPEDLSAYGQASGNIARQFGQQGNNLASMLSQNGLSSSSAPSAAAFSGLAGNQNEQLAQSQLAIAQNRINTAQQLAQARTNADLNNQAQTGALMQGLGQLGQSAKQGSLNNLNNGAQSQYNQLAGLSGLNAGLAGQQQNVNNSQWQQEQSSSFHPLSLLTAPLGAITGAVGGALGNSAGNAVGNAIGGNTSNIGG